MKNFLNLGASSKQWIKCLAKGHNTMHPVKLKTATSLLKFSTLSQSHSAHRAYHGSEFVVANT